MVKQSEIIPQCGGTNYTQLQNDINQSTCIKDKIHNLVVMIVVLKLQSTFNTSSVILAWNCLGFICKIHNLVVMIVVLKLQSTFNTSSVILAWNCLAFICTALALSHRPYKHIHIHEQMSISKCNTVHFIINHHSLVTIYMQTLSST